MCRERSRRAVGHQVMKSTSGSGRGRSGRRVARKEESESGRGGLTPYKVQVCSGFKCCLDSRGGFGGTVPPPQVSCVPCL